MVAGAAPVADCKIEKKRCDSALLIRVGQVAFHFDGQGTDFLRVKLN